MAIVPVVTTPANSGQGDSPKAAFDKINSSISQLAAAQTTPALAALLTNAGVGGNVQVLTQAGGASQVYTVPAFAQAVRAILIGGGGGGGSGSRGGVTGSVAAGGGGAGQAGGLTIIDIPAALLGGSVTVTFSNAATGGNGGAGVAAANGNNGVAGSNVQFGNFGIAYGGAAGNAGTAAGGGTSPASVPACTGRAGRAPLAVRPPATTQATRPRLPLAQPQWPPWAAVAGRG